MSLLNGRSILTFRKNERKILITYGDLGSGTLYINSYDPMGAEAVYNVTSEDCTLVSSKESYNGQTIEYDGKYLYYNDNGKDEDKNVPFCLCYVGGRVKDPEIEFERNYPNAKWDKLIKECYRDDVYCKLQNTFWVYHDEIWTDYVIKPGNERMRPTDIYFDRKFLTKKEFNSQPKRNHTTTQRKQKISFE
jgi:hypothetical protein